MASTTSSSVDTSMNSEVEGPKMNQCVICYYTYNRTNRAPVSMPCGHTFCRQCCIRQTTVEKLFSCGVCRQVSVIGLNGTEKNLTLIEILESLNLLDTDDSVEGASKDSDAPLEITKQQAEVITDAMQTLAKFIKHKFSEDAETANLLEDAVSAVGDVFGFGEFESDEDDWDDIEDEDDDELGDDEEEDDEAEDNENEDEADEVGLRAMPRTFPTLQSMNARLPMHIAMNPAVLRAYALRPNQQISGSGHVAETGASNNINETVLRAFELFQKEYLPLAADNINNQI
uniref:RING-type domain-containing protein n=1 Tax=Panagrellus redivivus TaxID=6233 RepID=A0A7E4UR73_PANRE